jgi:hypothetical protein
MENGFSPFLKKMGVEDTEDSKGWVKNQNDLKEIDKGLHPLKLTEETEYSVKSKENRHESSGIFPNHSDFVTLPVEISDAHIIQSPKTGQKEREEDRNPCDDQESPKLKLSFWNQ